MKNQDEDTWYFFDSNRRNITCLNHSLREWRNSIEIHVIHRNIRRNISIIASYINNIPLNGKTISISVKKTISSKLIIG